MGDSYDPEYEVWELGKLSALREIALAVEGQHRYYYMGLYSDHDSRP
jgi:arginine-tRNA-protein transferase